MKIWHYTVAPHYNNIVKDGFIKLATLYVSEGEKPAVWLSSNPNYEETVRKSLHDNETGEGMNDLSRDELFEKGVTPVRLEINSGFPINFDGNIQFLPLENTNNFSDGFCKCLCVHFSIF